MSLPLMSLSLLILSLLSLSQELYLWKSAMSSSCPVFSDNPLTFHCYPVHTGA